MSGIAQSINNNSNKILAFGALALGAYAIHASGEFENGSCLSRYYDCQAVQYQYNLLDYSQTSLCHFLPCTRNVIQSAQNKLYEGIALIGCAIGYVLVPKIKQAFCRIVRGE